MNLTACVAARKFAQRHERGETRRPRTSWNPIGFRWRRAARPAAPRFGRPPSPVVSHAWFPQFHLHVGAAEKASERPRQFPAHLPRATTIIWRQAPELLLQGRPLVPGERRSAAREQQLGGAGPRFALRRFNSREIPAAIPAAAAQSAPGRVRQVFRHTAATPLHRAVVPASADGRTAIHTATPVRRRTYAAPLQWRARGQSVARESFIELSEGPALRASVRPPAVVMDRAPELVWRARAKSTMSAVTEPACEGVTPSPIAAARIASFCPTSPAVASQTRESANARPVALDPAVVDRIADDVIRRVERRARIERERRGL
jgi:hypothetical protein